MELFQMELLEISSRTTNTEISVYTGDRNGSFKYSGALYPEKNDPDCFQLPKDTIYFSITEVETLITPDGKKYVSRDNKQNVYMGHPYSIEEAKKKNPEYISQLSYCQDRYQSERVVVRKDGLMSIMNKGAITYNEYCEQHKQSQEKKAYSKLI